MFKVFIFLLSFGLTVLGFMYMIVYLNLLDQGYSFIQYIKFISNKIECLMGIIGFIMINIIIMKGRDKYDLYI